MTKHSRGTQAGDKRGLKKGLRGLIGSRLGKGLTGTCRSSNGKYTQQDLAGGQRFPL